MYSSLFCIVASAAVLGVSAIDADVCIVGAGVSGMFTGYNLAKRGAKVAMIETRSNPGGNCYTCYYDANAPVGGKICQPRTGAANQMFQETGARYFYNDPLMTDTFNELNVPFQLGTERNGLNLTNVITDMKKPLLTQCLNGGIPESAFTAFAGPQYQTAFDAAVAAYTGAFFTHYSYLGEAVPVIPETEAEGLSSAFPKPWESFGTFIDLFEQIDPATGNTVNILEPLYVLFVQVLQGSGFGAVRDMTIYNALMAFPPDVADLFLVEDQSIEATNGCSDIYETMQTAMEGLGAEFKFNAVETRALSRSSSGFQLESQTCNDETFPDQTCTDKEMEFSHNEYYFCWRWWPCQRAVYRPVRTVFNCGKVITAFKQSSWSMDAIFGDVLNAEEAEVFSGIAGTNYFTGVWDTAASIADKTSWFGMDFQLDELLEVFGNPPDFSGIVDFPDLGSVTWVVNGNPNKPTTTFTDFQCPNLGGFLDFVGLDEVGDFLEQATFVPEKVNNGVFNALMPCPGTSSPDDYDPNVFETIADFFTGQLWDRATMNDRYFRDQATHQIKNMLNIESSLGDPFLWQQHVDMNPHYDGADIDVNGANKYNRLHALNEGSGNEGNLFHVGALLTTENTFAVWRHGLEIADVVCTSTATCT